MDRLNEILLISSNQTILEVHPFVKTNLCKGREPDWAGIEHGLDTLELFTCESWSWQSNDTFSFRKHLDPLFSLFSSTIKHDPVTFINNYGWALPDFHEVCALTCCLQIFLSVIIDTWVPWVLVSVGLQAHRADECFKLLRVPEDQVAILAYDECRGPLHLGLDNSSCSTQECFTITHAKL